MAHDVFISHSARDKPVADAVCAKLESHGIRCWIAPRDIRPGMEWGAALLEAIDGARVMLLVFSSHANGSPQISREVERAVSKGLVVVPVRVEDVKPTGNLEYFLGTPHWLDAITPPFERHLDHIADSAKFWLDRIESERGGSEAPRPPEPAREVPAAAPAPAAVAPRSRPKWIVPSIAALVIALVGTAAFFGTRYFLPKPEPALRNEPEHAATAVQTPEPAANAQTPESAAIAQTAEAISAPSAEVFNQIAERAAARSQAPGFAFLVLYQGRVLFSRGYGLADIQQKLAVTPNTRFAIGAVSKQFTAASILLLHQRGRLSLDDKLSTWLPQLPNANRITLAMLLYDTSGLHNFPFVHEHEWPRRGPVAPDKIFGVLATDKPDFEPGSQLANSNTGYAALAEVVSRISGESYSEFLRTNIFAPLQMSDSGNGYEAQKAGIAAPYRGVGSFSREDGVSLDLYYGAGSIVSTVVDLAKWDRALLSGSILGPASMHSLWTAGTLANGEPIHYAMGFVPMTLDGHREVWHNGYVPLAGGFCMNAIFPDDRLAIVVLSNGKDFEGQPAQIVRQAFEAFFPPAEDPSVSALVRKIFSQVRQGKVEKLLFTKDMNEVFRSQMPTVMNRYGALGDLGALVLQGSSPENGGTKYTYLGTFAAGERHIEIFIGPRGKVAGYKIGP